MRRFIFKCSIGIKWPTSISLKRWSLMLEWSSYVMLLSIHGDDLFDSSMFIINDEPAACDSRYTSIVDNFEYIISKDLFNFSKNGSILKQKNVHSGSSGHCMTYHTYSDFSTFNGYKWNINFSTGIFSLSKRSRCRHFEYELSLWITSSKGVKTFFM